MYVCVCVCAQKLYIQDLTKNITDVQELIFLFFNSTKNYIQTIEAYMELKWYQRPQPKSLHT